MRYFAAVLILASALAIPALPQNSSPFVGRWDFDITTDAGPRANWLGITEKNGNFEVWFQPTGGHVHPVKDFHVDGSHLTLTVSSASETPRHDLELDATDSKLTGVQKQGDQSTRLTVCGRRN